MKKQLLPIWIYGVYFIRLTFTMVPLKIRPFTLPQLVEEGKKVQLICGLEEGDGEVDFTWFKDEVPIVSETRWTIVTHETFSVLEMDNVKVAGSGNFTCVAANAFGKDRHTAVLSVQGPPTWKDEPSDTEVRVGESVALPCSAYGSPAPSVVWTKLDSSSGTSTEDLQMFVDRDGIFRIEDVQRNDEGSYTCIVQNGIGSPLQKTIEIKVKGNVEAFVKLL